MLLVAAIGYGLWLAHHRRPAPEALKPIAKPALTAPRFVGSAACAKCHRAEYSLWRVSHHELAMQPASDATVLGNFRNVTVRSNGMAATFFRRGSDFMVKTAGPDGASHDYQIKFTFGVFPLQQYLIPMPGGRLQALGVAWDSRPEAAGGQRWLFLFPAAKPGGALFWTGIDQTWNFMCADCHSTNLRKNYDLHTGSYATTYAEISVGCEACHGPGSIHIVWAKRRKGWEKVAATEGLLVQYHERRGPLWTIDPATGDAKPRPRRRTFAEINTCARCHSRRSQIKEDYVHGQPIGDDYRVSLLNEGLYYPDGQIKAEVYEYGSFLQSRMYHAGVTCSDCHNPHSLRLRAEGNGVCLQCHLARKYDSPAHHHHKLGAAGSRCIECHMPTRTYMMVHQRHDHSLRIPRPDLSTKLNVPNACNGCHKDRSAKWAAAAISSWYGHSPVGYQRFAEVLAAATSGAPGAEKGLVNLAADTDQPAIARATAISRLGAYAQADAAEAVRNAVTDPNPLVRRAAASSVTTLAPSAAAAVLAPLLRDKILDVRLEAAVSAELNSLATRPGILGAYLDRAVAEYVAAQDLNADRPEAHVNLGLLYQAMSDSQRAIAELKLAGLIDPSFTPATIDLADLYRQLGRDSEGSAVLAGALKREPQDATLLHAMGLYLVRANRHADALRDLAAAAHLQPDNARFGYVYALALQDAGESGAAIGALELVLRHHPYDRDSLTALVGIYARKDNRDQALAYATRLRELEPNDPGIEREIDLLRAMPER
jgi:tetratricopeptide (TPR) repeat protein